LNADADESELNQTKEAEGTRAMWTHNLDGPLASVRVAHHDDRRAG
jgi:uncharacterized protein Usg